MSRRTLTAGFALLTTLVAAAPALAQGFPAASQRSFAELRSQVAMQAGSDSQQLQLRWFTTASIVNGVAQSEADVQVVDRRHGAGPLGVDRNPELAPDRVVIVSVDNLGREVDWRVVPDPRIVRAEFPDGRGRLSGTTLRRTEASLLVDIPDDSAITSLRIYEPMPTSDGLVLSLVSTVVLP